MPPADRYRPIIFTDDASVLSVNEPPLSLDRVREQMIEPLEGTPASLWWSVGDHEVFHHETEIGEIIGDGVDDFEKYDYFHSFSAAQFKRVSDNTRHLMQTTGGPLTTLIGMCREAGIEFFPRVRMNSHYRKDPSTPDYGRFRRDHPELLIGRPGEDIPVGSHEWHIRTGLNYAFPEVRRFMASIVTELFERFDVDGVEMDFNRHPAFFRPNEAAAHGYLVTDLVRHVRRRMDEVGAARGKRILLAVRVPPTLADSRRVGLDVRQWIAEGLVDIVTAGIGFVLFDLPIREFVEAARGTGVKVYGCIEALRPAVDQRVMRAMAKRCWDAGADGIYLYNFFPLPGDWRRPILNELADPDRLERLDARYELDSREWTGLIGAHTGLVGSHIAAFQGAMPRLQLPVTLHDTLTGAGAVIQFEIAHKIEAARADGSLGGCALGLRLQGLTQDDTLSVTLNGHHLPWETANVSFDGWTQMHLDGDAFETYPSRVVERVHDGVEVLFPTPCPPLRYGKNALEVRLLRADNPSAQEVVLKGVHITITYEPC